jgi:hypothetical protein
LLDAGHCRGHDVGRCPFFDAVAQQTQRVDAGGVGAQEGAVASVGVGENPRTLQVGQPEADQPVCAVGIFFGVVVDQVPVGAQEVGAAPRVGEQLFVEHQDLQAEVEQGLL